MFIAGIQDCGWHNSAIIIPMIIIPEMDISGILINCCLWYAVDHWPDILFMSHLFCNAVHRFRLGCGLVLCMIISISIYLKSKVDKICRRQFIFQIYFASFCILFSFFCCVHLNTQLWFFRQIKTYLEPFCTQS